MQTPDFATGNPETRGQIEAALARLDDAIEAAFAGLPATTFFAPQGDKWSPAEHLRHLVKSVRAVAFGLRMPKLVLALRFGLRFRPSRGFAGIVEIYHRALAGGGRAGGPFLPSPRPEGLTDEAWRDKTLAAWRAAGAELRAQIPRWSEGALDRHLLPHPLLGKLSVREMLCFTLYHNHHHAARVFERLDPPPAA